MAPPTETCCRKNEGGECVCAEKATCSCGKERAGHCTCEKAPQENTISGASCSCGARPEGKCTCGKAAGKPPGAACICGATTCKCNEKNETDFTAKK